MGQSCATPPRINLLVNGAWQDVLAEAEGLSDAKAYIAQACRHAHQLQGCCAYANEATGLYCEFDGTPRL